MDITYKKGSYKEMTLEERQRHFNNIIQFLKENGKQYNLNIETFITDMINHISDIINNFVNGLKNDIESVDINLYKLKDYFEYYTVEHPFKPSKDSKSIIYFMGYKDYFECVYKRVCYEWLDDDFIRNKLVERLKGEISYIQRCIDNKEKEISTLKEKRDKLTEKLNKL